MHTHTHKNRASLITHHTMSANKFASINTNKLTLILTYVLLEWTLIILLLLNSIFSYFIIKFAQFFALKPPCSWCIRLDRFFEPQNHNSHTPILCEHHSKEVSQLQFCYKHKKLAECYNLCDNCSSGVKNVDFVIKDEGFDDLCLKCSCCGDDFDGFCVNRDLIVDLIEFGEELEVQFQGKETEELEIELINEDLIQFEKREKLNHETTIQDLEFCLDYSGNQLVQIDSIDRNSEKLQDDLEVDEDQEFGDFQKANSVLEIEVKTDESSKFAEFDSMGFEENENCLVFHANLSGCMDEKLVNFEPNQALFDAKEEQETEESDLDHEEAASCLVLNANLSGYVDEKLAIFEPKQATFDTKEEQETEECGSEHDEAEVSIGTEIPVLDSCDEMQAQDNFNLYSLSHEQHSSSSHDLDFNLDYGFEEDEKTEELKNLNQQDDTLLMVERKDSMVDEFCDGSEMDGGDPIDTTEKMKSALRAERKALQALYMELEEERSASAVAASETMAMINRLQEEKAAMQMEALHYQRMMEEQSEYDQEALQLLNELMVKKDKELELYRKKVLEMELELELSRSNVKSGTCSVSCSHSEDGDRMWLDLNHELKEEGIGNGNKESRNWNQNNPVDTIMNLDLSFVNNFEDERLSILEQLKVLEEKLCTLSDEEHQHFADLKHIEDYFEDNGKHLNGIYEYNGQQVNGITRYQDRGPIGSTGKQLLPLFDALETKSDDDVISSNGNGNGFHSDKVENNTISRFELQKKRIDIEEEVEQLYIRLQALEADREFLKHCIGSLKKGDKGMELLQEILQHLRDLKNVDLPERSFTDGTLV